MSEFEEGYLKFTFTDAKWPAVRKYDDRSNTVYQEMRKHLQWEKRGTKAVDFVIGNAKECWFIEVKDFRGHPIENKKRMSGKGELPLETEVALKVCDSLAGVIGARRNPSMSEEWEGIVSPLIDPKKTVKVVLWLEYDDTRVTKDWDAQANVIQSSLKKKLGWLTSKVMVVNRKNMRPDFGIIVENLPHGGESARR